MSEIEGAMRDARAYAETKAAGKLLKTDLRWEAMLPVIDGTKALGKPIPKRTFARPSNFPSVTRSEWCSSAADAWLL